jgi:putative Holliday junction resolvase
VGRQADGRRLPRGCRLAVDVGAVRVGLAASDPDGLVATPVTTLTRDQRTAVAVAHEADDRQAAVVYVGLPRRLDGTAGPAEAAARDFADELARAFVVSRVSGPEFDRRTPSPEVRLVDERLTTVSAQSALREAGVRGRAARRVVDQAAAVVILQAALDVERAQHRRAGEPVGAAGAEGTTP